MYVKLHGLVLTAVILLSVIAIINGFSGAVSTAGTTVITVSIAPAVLVSAHADTCLWEFSPSGPGVYTKKEVVNIKANTNWQVAVKDKDGVTTGHMTEWTGTDYISRKLKAPLSVSAYREVTLPEGGTIQTGTTIGEHDIEVTLTQVVSQDDMPLEDGHVYRIVLSFEGSPME